MAARFLLLAIVVLNACIGPQHVPRRIFTPTESRDRSDYEATGDHGMVVSAHPLATAAGLEILKAGGTAADAAVTVSLMTSVVRPHSTGIGGGGFLLYYDKATDKVTAYDFRERAPAGASRNMYLGKDGEPKTTTHNGVLIEKPSVNGYLAGGVPGLIAGIVRVHADFGKLSFAETVAPATNLARDGFPVYDELDSALKYRAEVMRNFPSTRAIFFPQGPALKTGDLLVQKDLATTLDRIAQHGHYDFYEGETARLIAEDMKQNGIITLEDLKSYSVKIRPPVTGTYRDYKVVSMPPPSSGGIHIVQMLNMLEKDHPNALATENYADYVHLVAEVMRRAFADRANHLGDPEFYQVPQKGLISKRYAHDLRKTIAPTTATPSSELSNAPPAPYESDSTTHFSIVDRWGNAVSSTQTINTTFGSGVVLAGTGIVLNNEMDDFSIKPGVPNAYGLVGGEANAIEAQKTMLSSMSPTMVFDPSGKLEMIVGSPGGPRIINATFQTIVNYIDHGMPLADAVHFLRFHHQYLPDEIRIEPGALTPLEKEVLVNYGHQVTVKQYPIGDVQAIARTKNGWVGVSDTRSTGQPMGY